MAKTRQRGHDHSQATGEEWVTAARTKLSSSGYRAGGARSAVLELLGSEGGCCNADDLAQELRDGDRSVGTASVYRALSLLADLGLVQKVAVAGAPTRFELILPGGEHHHHIVCEGCGKTVPFSDEKLEVVMSEISERAPFRVDSHDVTLLGTCDACRG